MKDYFFDAKVCDRCGKSLENGRIMSMFNTDVLCADCKKKEAERKDYRDAVDAVRAAEMGGNRNFGGIGLNN